MSPKSEQRVLNDQERLDWLRLIRSENVGPITFAHLLARFGSAADALRALPEMARRGGRDRPLQIASRAMAEAEMERARRAGARLIGLIEPDYPSLLAAIDGPPPILFAIGHAHLGRLPAVAVVGARNASAAGTKMAQLIVAPLATAGFVIVSGLARGIDGAAHRAALTHGTIAVMAGGVDTIYPPDHRELYQAIAQEGLIISEMAMGEEPQARHFPRRNRLISGLALGVVVIEAAKGSGSLITARFALDQGREIFAVPGSPLDPRCAGSNGLLRDGAHLTESAEDVRRVLADIVGRGSLRMPNLPAHTAPPTPMQADQLETARHLVGDALSPTPVEIDEITRQTNLAPGVIALVLLELDLAGRLVRHPGQKVSLL